MIDVSPPLVNITLDEETDVFTIQGLSQLDEKGISKVFFAAEGIYISLRKGTPLPSEAEISIN